MRDAGHKPACSRLSPHVRAGAGHWLANPKPNPNQVQDVGRLELAHNGCVDALRLLLSKRLELVQLMFGADTLKADWEQARCTACAPHLHRICTASAPHLHRICTACAPHVHRMCTACAPHVHRTHTARTLHPYFMCTVCALHAYCLSAVGAEPPHRRTAVAAGGAARDGGSSRRAADARLLLQATPRGARPLRAPRVPGVPTAGRVGNGSSRLRSSRTDTKVGGRSRCARTARRAPPPAVLLTPSHTTLHGGQMWIPYKPFPSIPTKIGT